MAEKFAKIEAEIPAWEEPKPTVVAKKTVTIRHRVKRGETLTSLARKYRTSASAIRSANRLSSNKRLRAGRIVRIPIPSYRYEKIQASSADTGKTLTHRIRRGETLSSVARRYGVSVSDLKRTNRLRSNTIRTGQILRIAKQAAKTYVVKKGDTLTKIALKNGTTLKALKEMNGLGEGGHIYPGQSIVLE
jgi:LysM repeat protein